MQNNSYLTPPGTYFDIYEHPIIGSTKAVEVACMQDHRFAFFYWHKWTNKLSKKCLPAPSVVSLDWHEDLAAPDKDEQEDLRNLNTQNYRDVALFCWEALNPLNDGHLLAAAYLDLISDIHVLQKQFASSTGSFIDRNGNPHKICCYESVSDLVESLSDLHYESIYFDIDLDYFTDRPDSDGGGENVVLADDKEIRDVLSSDGALMSWLLKRIEGMTIATEPVFCGGMSNSNRIFATVNDIFFDPPFLNTGSKWKHHP